MFCHGIYFRRQFISVALTVRDDVDNEEGVTESESDDSEAQESADHESDRPAARNVCSSSSVVQCHIVTHVHTTKMRERKAGSLPSRKRHMPSKESRFSVNNRLLIAWILSIINNIAIDKVLIRSFGYQSIIDNTTLLSKNY
jgi:hypothetical protein